MNLFTICIVLGCGLAFAMPSGPAKTNDAEDPDLLQMLDYFKGKSDMSLVAKTLKQFKIGRELVESIFGICPQCKLIFEAAAKTNVGFRIFCKMIQGQIPDLRDMYDLATKGTGDISGSFTEASRKNKKYNMLTQALLSNSSRSLASASQIEQDLNLFTGKTFSLDPELVRGVYEGTVQLTRDNLVQVNLLEVMSSWKQNFALFNNLIISLMKLSKTRDMFIPLSIIKDLDFSNLSKVKIMNGGMDNDKYTVVEGKQNMVTDPDVAEMMKDIQQIQRLLKNKSHVKAEALIFDTLVKYMKVTTKVIKDAEADRKIAPA